MQFVTFVAYGCQPGKRRQVKARPGPSLRAARQRAAVTILFAGLLLGCGGPPPVTFPGTASGELTIRYPLDETLFPPDIVAPTFVWTDATEDVAQWQVLVRLDGATEFEQFSTDKPQWRPTAEYWNRLKQQTVDRPAEVAFVGVNDASATRSTASVRIRTAADPVTDSIFYREVPLPFIDAVQDPSKIRWRFGSIDSEQRPHIVLENLPVCGNCHSFADDGSTLGLDVDYGNDKGGYAVLPVSQNMVMNDEKIITWSDYKRDDGEATFGLLSQVSPDGRYVISTVKDRAVFVATPDIAFSQLFFPIKGILVVYDTVTGTYAPLPGADDPDYVQSNPTWSPDGQSIVFARAKVYRKPSIEDATSILLDEKDVPEFVEDNHPFKYDLYRVPFNEGRGGEPVPIAGASHNGMSNFFAKYSPDGKWIVFCKAENYMLLMPDSELYIIPADGGEARRLRANTPLMNSWHSWSSNGKWLVFSSKAFTPYTQLFLTHIDDNGHSTPPVLLDHFTDTDRAANIPEFVPIPADSIAQIKEQFLDAYSFLRAGMANERTGNYPGAVRVYERGLAIDPDNVELLNSMGFALFQKGESAKAVPVLQKALAIDPQHSKAHNNLALASIDIGELELAEAHYRESLAIEPQPAIFNDLGVVLARQGMLEDAADQYRAAITLDPGAESAHYNLGATLAQLGELDEATVQLNHAIHANPNNASAYQLLADVLVQQQKLDQAADAYRRLIRQQPSAAAHRNLAQVLTRLGRTAEAQTETARANAMQAAPTGTL